MQIQSGPSIVSADAAIKDASATCVPVPCACPQWLALGVCTAAASLLEAITTQIDNLFLPLFFYVSLCLAASRVLA